MEPTADPWRGTIGRPVWLPLRRTNKHDSFARDARGRTGNLPPCLIQNLGPHPWSIQRFRAQNGEINPLGPTAFGARENPSTQRMDGIKPNTLTP